MSGENNKNEYITRKDLKEQTQVLLTAMDSIVVRKIEEAKNELKADINNVQTLIDGYVKEQESFKQ